jgi:hypothetical protein
MKMGQHAGQAKESDTFADPKAVGSSNFLIGILTNLSHAPSCGNRRFSKVTTRDLKTAGTAEQNASRIMQIHPEMNEKSFGQCAG